MVLEPQMHDALNIDSINEVERMRCDRHADSRLCALLLNQLDEFALVRIVEMRIGLVVGNNYGSVFRAGHIKKIPCPLPNGEVYPAASAGT